MDKKFKASIQKYSKLRFNTRDYYFSNTSKQKIKSNEKWKTCESGNLCGALF